jgi:hypothetical protein
MFFTELSNIGEQLITAKRLGFGEELFTKILLASQRIRDAIDESIRIPNHLFREVLTLITPRRRHQRIL